jgi:hypothetical protein
MAATPTNITAKHKNSEVSVEKVGDAACVLSYVNGDFLTTEGTPVSYTFQAEINDGGLKMGTHFWAPHPLKPNKVTTLSFNDGKKIYQYSDKLSEYGTGFYQTDLFEHFKIAQKIEITQGALSKHMPRYSKHAFPKSVRRAFQVCLDDLALELKKYCQSSPAAEQKCRANKAQNKKPFSGLIIKDDPAYIAELTLLAELKVQQEEQQKKLAAEKAVAEKKARIALEKLALEQEKEIARAKNAEITSMALAREVIVKPQTYDKEILSIFADNVKEGFKIKTYTQFGGSISSSIRSDNEQQMALRVRFDTSKGVFYYQSQRATDYSKYKYLEFDLKVLKDPRDSGGFTIKMDCGSSCSSGNYAISTPKLGLWQHYNINLETLISLPGSTLDLTKVNVPFAILPDWGNQRGVVFMLDNVRLVN